MKYRTLRKKNDTRMLFYSWAYFNHYPILPQKRTNCMLNGSDCLLLLILTTKGASYKTRPGRPR